MESKSFDKLKAKGDFSIFIELIKELNNGAEQKWVFFNSTETFEVKVLLKDDGYGGAYFTLSDIK
ncbi:MAG: hypothetical protein K1060chlam5_01226 [Candidatus Anoxychlamydiales bacterium]|nr:hypothetical protein [Candidatus Anoxychlamydiales bacterium]